MAIKNDTDSEKMLAEIQRREAESKAAAAASKVPARNNQIHREPTTSTLPGWQYTWGPPPGYEAPQDKPDTGGSPPPQLTSSGPGLTNYASQYGNVNTTNPQLQSGEDLAKLFGGIFGYDQILGILNQATEARFNEWSKQTEGIRDQSLTDHASQYNQYLQNSRQNRQNAVRHGLQKGSSVAQEVMGQLGAQQGGAENQGQFQQQLAEIASQRGSQLAYDKTMAMNTQNQLASQYGDLSVTQYSNQVQEKSAELLHHGQLVAADAQVRAYAIQGNATRYAAELNKLASDHAAELGFKGKELDAATHTIFKNSLVSAGWPDWLASSVATGNMSMKDGMAQKEKLELESSKVTPQAPYYGQLPQGNNPQGLPTDWMNDPSSSWKPQ